MRLLFGTLFSLIVAAAIGLGATWLALTDGTAYGGVSLAVEALKMFHTGVSEDFLLKQDQFKDLRDLPHPRRGARRAARGHAARATGSRRW